MDNRKDRSDKHKHNGQSSSSTSNRNERNETADSVNQADLKPNEIKLELMKKKAQLAEMRRRKLEREQEKLEQSKLNKSNSTQTCLSMLNDYNYSQNGHIHLSKLNHSKSGSFSTTRFNYFNSNPLSEFENLNADEIIAKCGLNETNNSLSTNNGGKFKTKSSTLTPSSSSFSLSLSSSNQSLNSSVTTTSTLQYSNRKITNSSIPLSENDLNEINGLNDSIYKKMENLNLTSQTNLNVVDIYPNEPIRYSKETQTLECFDFNSNEIGSHDGNESTDDGSEIYEKSANLKNGKSNCGDSFRKKKKKAKPLAFYDDIFVYDTLQWEDEFMPIEIEGEDLNSNNVAVGDGQNLNESIKTNRTDSNESEQPNFIKNSDHPDDEDIVDAAVSNWNRKNNLVNGKPNSKNDLNVDDFVRFIKEKRPIIERALRQNEKNIFFDYSATPETEKTKEDLSDETIKLKKTFSVTEKWSSSVITCLDWSFQYPELILCSYDNMSFNYEEAASEAVAVLWNVKSDQKAPQQTFTCTSLITSCVFSSFYPNLIVAGTYSGQIVMWDVRSNKRTPIQRSSLSISSHVNPVFCIKVIGTNDSQSLVSISNDGKLCHWSLENLNLPYDTQDLVLKHSTNRNVYATCFDFQTVVNSDDNNSFKQSIDYAYGGSNNNLNKSTTQQTTNGETQSINTNSGLNNRFAVVGAEDGLAHTLSINSGNKFNMHESFDDHLGPITAVSCYNQCSTDTNDNPYAVNASLSQLFLTSSFDSTVKLWSMSDNSNPIYTFECNGDYVYDIGWSPVHPSLFACVDGTGKLDLWNLNKDFEVASASIEVDNRARALNRLKWSRKGTEIAVGDDHGQISIYEINENFVRPSPDDSRKFLNTVNNLKQLTSESNCFGKSNKLNYLIESIR